MRIIDPTETADDAAYAGMRTLLGITDTNAQIDANPLFASSENYILSLLPAFALPDGRTAANRGQVILALQYLFSSFVLESGYEGEVTEDAERSENVRRKTQSVGVVTLTEEFESSSSSGSSHHSLLRSTDERADWYKSQADAILKGLGATIDTAGGLSASVLLTESRLK